MQNIHVDVQYHYVVYLRRGDIMPCTEARKRANAAYNRRQDNIMIRPSKEEGAQIRQAAADAGQSVQAYILEAIRNRMQKDQL